MSLRVELNKELERKFRQAAMKRFGYSKGSIKKAAEMAIRKWSAESMVEESKKQVMDPVELMEGLLIELKGKKTSVELQHEARKLWAKVGKD